MEEEVADLRMQVQQLTQVCAETREELLTHRQVLEQCLEVRESCMEILNHREAILNSARIISDMGDRTAELDLSLAGVSDNTARHGKAISALTEQQKRTSTTLDAVVRAVKRFDHRSRSRSRSACAGAPPLPPQPQQQASVSTPCDAELEGMVLPTVLGDGQGGSRDRGGEGDEGLEVGIDACTAPSSGGLPSGAPSSQHVSHNRAPVQEMTLMAPGASGVDVWNEFPDPPTVNGYPGTEGVWSDWPGGWSNGYDERRPCVYEDDEPRILYGGGMLNSGSSSCGSDARQVHGHGHPHSHQQSAVPGRSRRSGRSGPGSGPIASSGGSGGSGPPAATGEMAHRVKGVLARIEEALVKLDSNGGTAAVRSANAAGREAGGGGGASDHSGHAGGANHGVGHGGHSGRGGHAGGGENGDRTERGDRGGCAGCGSRTPPAHGSSQWDADGAQWMDGPNGGPTAGVRSRSSGASGGHVHGGRVVTARPGSAVAGSRTHRAVAGASDGVAVPAGVVGCGSGGSGGISGGSTTPRRYRQRSGGATARPRDSWRPADSWA
eukprot:TRINITY_DN19293_c0_g1_i1.p1 TRINITY_DN19293_c0_g1~~TRINITY_DN19293_c0_g1_i1.p1  ORF type:complete len:551 (-),score=102.17 TRINITY_DN19293_c0_g1_i1:179-1831(-)